MRFVFSLVVALILFPAATLASDLSLAKEPGYFVMLRHAYAPGTGDPANFSLNDCQTQRNLNAEGRDQAKTIGDLFRQAGVKSADIYSSQWCRCMDTAWEMELGDVRELPPLNSFFGRYEREAGQMKDLRDWLSKQPLQKPLILVTHQVVMTSLTGVFPSSGEIFILKRSENGNLDLVKRIRTLER
ncbi:histidine phosphatase family protein [Sneathiella limimaris]|uniref:histidine phosphatase family protein n=1 Tax=Sneathiella limimaris TaxID=1964213 RepID=UPI00146A26BC|nr:histidine phosphatase family protein [Sneathiella limimaris]